MKKTAVMLAVALMFSSVPVEVNAQEQMVLTYTQEEVSEIGQESQISNTIVSQDYNGQVNGLESLPDDPEFLKLQEMQNVSVMEARSLTGSTYIHNSRYNNCVIRNGIDVSYYQGTIDWNAVKSSGVEFVFIRVGYRGYGSGALAKDVKAEENLRGAINAGLKVGVYIFSQAINTWEAQQEAEFILNQIKGYHITMPVVIDYEYAGVGTGRLYNAHLSKQQATQNVNAFCEYIKKAGYEPMVYANAEMLEDSLNAGGIPYKVWLAHYTTQTYYQGNYEFWQYSSKGHVNGINGYVDSNFWYDKKEEKEEPIVYTKTIPDGIYTISTALNSNMVIDINGGSEENGANVQLWSYNNKNSQKFKVVYKGNGKYSIMALCSGKYLDAEAGGNTDGTNVIQYQGNNENNQRWHIVDKGNGYYAIISAASGLSLEVYNSGTAEGTNIQLSSANEENSQKFSFQEANGDGNDNASVRQGWYYENGKKYWYDNGVMARDKEVYDPATDAWYWFDDDGVMATNKDVFIPTKADRSEGKWVRYDSNGWMIKGEDYRYGGWYWFDPETGEMLKGFIHIPVDGDSEGKWVYYDEVNGQMHHGESCINGNWYYFDDFTGKMVHGEYQRNGNWYYYDINTGVMCHGWTVLPDGRTVYYDEITGIRR